MLDFTCSRCALPLLAPGGLLFSAPNSNQTVTKYHLCANCTEVFVAELTALHRNTIGPKDTPLDPQ